MHQPIPQIDPDEHVAKDCVLDDYEDQAPVKLFRVGADPNVSQLSSDHTEADAEEDSELALTGQRLGLEVEDPLEIRSSRSVKTLRNWVCLLLAASICAIFSIVFLLTTSTLSCSLDITSSGMMSKLGPYHLSVRFGYFQVCFLANSMDRDATTSQCVLIEEMNEPAHTWILKAQSMSITAGVLLIVLLLLSAMLPKISSSRVRCCLFMLSIVFACCTVLNSLAANFLFDYGPTGFDDLPEEQLIFANQNCVATFAYGGWFQIIVAGLQAICSIATANWAARRVDFTGVFDSLLPAN